MKALESFWRNSLTRLGVLKVESALNSFIWIVAFLAIAFVVAAIFAPPERDFVVWTLGMSFIAGLSVALSVGIGFAIFKPEKLQSEEYQLKHQEIEHHILRKSEDGPILIQNDRPTSPSKILPEAQTGVQK